MSQRVLMGEPTETADLKWQESMDTVKTVREPVWDQPRPSAVCDPCVACSLNKASNSDLSLVLIWAW